MAAAEQPDAPFLQFDNDNHIQEENNPEQIEHHKNDNGYMEILTVLFDLIVIGITAVDMALKIWIIISTQFPVLETICLSVVHFIYIVILKASLKSLPTMSKSRTILTSIMIFILSPFAPFIIYFLRLYRNDEWLKSNLQKYFQLTITPPNYPEIFEKNLFDDKGLNLCKWRSIVRYRCTGFSVQCSSSFVFIVIEGWRMLIRIMDNDGVYDHSELVMHSLSITITIISIIVKCFIIQYRDLVTFQSYIFNVSCIAADIVSYFMWSYLSLFLTSNYCYNCHLVLILYISVLPISFSIHGYLCDLRNKNDFSCMICLKQIVKYFAGFVYSCTIPVTFYIFLTYLNINKSLDKLFQFRFQFKSETKYTQNDIIFWTKMRQFMLKNDDDVYHKKKQQRIFKLCSINREIINEFKNYDNNGLDMFHQLNENDKAFEEFMELSEQQLFQNITKYSQFQKNTSNDPVITNIFVQVLFPDFSGFWKWSMVKFDEYGENIFILPFWITYFGIYLLTLFLSGMYYISRIINILLPLIIWIYVWNNDLWHEIYFIQWFTMIVFSILSFCISLKIWEEIKIAYLFRNILPFHKIPPIEDEKDIDFHSNRIYDYYIELKYIPLREEIIIDFFGPDIGAVINQYISRFASLEPMEFGMQQIEINDDGRNPLID